MADEQPGSLPAILNSATSVARPMTTSVQKIARQSDHAGYVSSRIKTISDFVQTRIGMPHVPAP